MSCCMRSSSAAIAAASSAAYASSVALPSVFLRSACSFARCCLFISLTISSSLTLRLVAHSWMYIWRTTSLGITEMLFTTFVTNSARFKGSLCASLINKSILNLIKSTWCVSMYFWNSSALCLRAKLSGSSPSGSSSTFMFNPSANNISMPRKLALIPAASPS